MAGVVETVRVALGLDGSASPAPTALAAGAQTQQSASDWVFSFNRGAGTESKVDCGHEEEFH